jgi:hypothetical protein
VDIESPIKALPGLAAIRCSAAGKELVLLTRNTPVSGGSMALLNTHTFNQADFDAVGEVLLCPRRLGLQDLPEPALTALRAAFHPRKARARAALHGRNQTVPVFSGPGSVCFHPLAGDQVSFVVQNFNDQAVDVQIQMGMPGQKASQFRELFSGQAVRTEASDGQIVLTLSIPARDRSWVQRIH